MATNTQACQPSGFPSDWWDSRWTCGRAYWTDGAVAMSALCIFHPSRHRHLRPLGCVRHGDGSQSEHRRSAQCWLLRIPVPVV